MCELVLRYLCPFGVVFFSYFVGYFNFLNIFILKGLALISIYLTLPGPHISPHLPPGGFPMVSTWLHWLIHQFESYLFLQSYFKRFVHRSFQVSATNIYIFRLDDHTHYGLARRVESDSRNTRYCCYNGLFITGRVDIHYEIITTIELGFVANSQRSYY